ncbi:non-homologous end joining protein Ku [Terrihabitans soli]|uniref:Non-homologous end joining protein Ku n=1 Tax=Terrihabitans soli TaxID=708113 RepID=A0A6S6QL51_9HYPH|nr:Ku protein [Terrihabitans soli]BCJ92063.1 non-homologous end joining protein Ku [Terrihabitans soli]
MAPRASWKGYLKLSLVSCSVALFPASNASERISFNTLNRETGNRLKQQMIDSETEEVVERDDRVKGYEFAKGNYVIVENEDLEKVQLESTHTIDIQQFVPEDEIDQVYLDGSHYLAPDDKVAQEAFAVIREAMKRKKVVGIATLVLNRRERIVALFPRGKGILVTTVNYKYEVRDDEAYFEDIPNVKIPGEMLELAEHIIDKKKGKFDPGKFEDRYENALIELLKAKQQGREIKVPKEAKPSNVINLMDALRRSIDGERGGKAAKSTSGKSSGEVRRPAAKSKTRSTKKTVAKKPAKRRAAG